MSAQPQPIPEQIPVRVRLTNRWAIFDCPPEVQVRLKKYFRYHPKNYQFRESYRNGSWDGWANLMARGRVPSGLFLARRSLLAGRFLLQVVDQRILPAFREISSEGMRPYQISALRRMVQASNSGGLVLSATATGKTRLAGAYFRALVGGGCFVVDELTLLEQSRREIERWLGEEVGVVGRSEFTPRRITVATIQTLDLHRKRKDFLRWFRTLEAVIVDEFHVSLNDRIDRVLRAIKPKAVFGLTATLLMEVPEIWMTAVSLAGPVVFEYPITVGVAEGHLAPGVVCCLKFFDPLRGEAAPYRSRVDGKTVWISGPQAEYRRHISLNAERNRAIEMIIREGLKWNRRIVILVTHRSHLRALDRRFPDVRHVALSGEVKTETRLDAMEEMDAGRLPLILATKVFAKGVNVPTLDMIVDASGAPSWEDALQRFGRGNRKSEGKRGLIHVDISDVGSPFARTAKARLKALRETGSPIVEIRWRGNAGEVLRECLKRLEGV